jgi:pimeloyl-ACP methyl ester carboxylesterase
VKLRALVRQASEAALTRAGRALDRGALRLLERQIAAPHAGHGDARARLVELAAHYGSPAMRADPGALFAAPAAADLASSDLGALGDARVTELRFASRYRPSYPGFVERHAAFAANLTAVARRYAGGATPRPTVIALHGLGAAGFAFNLRAFPVDRLLAAGLDVVLLQLPLHGERAATLAGAAPSFVSPDLVLTNESVGQAVDDVRALAAALRRDAPAVGVVGMSLGGYLAALTATVEPSLAFAAALSPAVDLGGLMWRHGAASRARRRADKAGVDLALLADVVAVHSPLGRPAKLPPERLFVAAGRADLITPPAEAEALARHWGVEVRWFAGAHLAQLGRDAAFAAWIEQLAALR